MSREADLLAALRRMPGAGKPAALARVLNFDAPCDWCPVGPPQPGQVCASVPVASRRAVERVLRSLCRAGAVEHLYPGTRMAFYALKGATSR